MATKALRFFRAAALPTTANSATIGDIYFIKPSSGDGQIWVCTSLNSSSIPQFIKYGDATVYTHPSVDRTDTTSTQTATHSGTFTCIDSVTISNGHVTGYNTKTVTLPGAYSLPTASTSIKGGIKIGTSLEMSGDVCNVVWTDFGS